MCAINLDCWLCALGASEKILFSQLAPKGTCHRRGTAVTNYSFCLGRSQTFLISYQRSSATLHCQHNLAAPVPQCLAPISTDTHIHYTPSRFLLSCGKSTTVFPFAPATKSDGGGERARSHSDGYPFNGAEEEQHVGLQTTRPPSRRFIYPHSIVDSRRGGGRDVKDVRSSFYIIYIYT